MLDERPDGVLDELGEVVGRGGREESFEPELVEHLGDVASLRPASDIDGTARLEIAARQLRRVVDATSDADAHVDGPQPLVELAA